MTDKNRTIAADEVVVGFIPAVVTSDALVAITSGAPSLNEGDAGYRFTITGPVIQKAHGEDTYTSLLIYPSVAEANKAAGATAVSIDGLVRLL